MKCWNGPTMTLLTVIVAWVTVIPMPQLWAQTRGHVLWGDFVIDMSQAPPGSPQTFQLVLTRIPGRVVDRQTVGSRDRYRFHGVSNGEYLLTIEVDHREILSMPLSIREFRPTDIPRHLSLQWSDLSGQSVDTSALMYARKAANQKRLDKAQGAMQKNDLKTAVILLQEVVDSDPQDYEAWTDLATCRFRQEKLSAAIEAYRNALSANPDYFIAQFQPGQGRVGAQELQCRRRVAGPSCRDGGEVGRGSLFSGRGLPGGSKGIQGFRAPGDGNSPGSRKDG